MQTLLVLASTLWSDAVVSPFFNVPMLKLSVEQEEEDALIYEPNIRPDFGVSVELWDFSFAVSQPIPEPSDDEEDDEVPAEQRRGKSTYRDYKLDVFRDHWGIEIGAHKYRGFDRELEDQDGLYEQHSDMRKEGRYTNLYWLPAGEEVGLGRSMIREPPSGKAWTPVVQLGYDHTRIQDDSGQLANRTFDSYILSAGAAARYGREKWQGTGMMLWGKSLMNGDESGSRFSFRMGGEHLRGRWIMGLALMMDQTTLPAGKTAIESTVGTMLMSFGTRLGGAPSESREAE